jgi:hypothetical protein
MSAIFENLSKKEILTVIAKNYSTLHYTPQLLDLLVLIHPNRDFSRLTKLGMHKVINTALMNSYAGEYLFKYVLFKQFQAKNLVAGFEMKVNNSRVDFLTINGSSTSFEIKSSIDNLSKLSKQAGDYLAAFEYNNVVVDEKHLEKCKTKIPDSFGIWVFKNNRYTVRKKASLNTSIDPQIQLSLLTKRELQICFNAVERNLIKENFTAKAINLQFKIALKKRYQNRWNFVVQHSPKILPIDLQFFFNTNISPSSIYG